MGRLSADTDRQFDKICDVIFPPQQQQLRRAFLLQEQRKKAQELAYAQSLHFCAVSLLFVSMDVPGHLVSLLGVGELSCIVPSAPAYHCPCGIVHAAVALQPF